MNKENKNSRFKKTKKQVETLNQYYKDKPLWDQKTIYELSQISNLPKEKIYKWYWDQNQKYRPNQPDNVDFNTEILLYQGQLYSESHKILRCTGCAMRQPTSQEFKNRLSLLAKDLILLQ